MTQTLRKTLRYGYTTMFLTMKKSHSEVLYGLPIVGLNVE